MKRRHSPGMSGWEADNFSCSFTGVRIGNTSEAFTIVNIIFTVVFQGNKL